MSKHDTRPRGTVAPRQSTVRKDEYFTALHAPKRAYPPVQHFSNDRVEAFVHDVFDPLPSSYDLVDVFYTDLPWKGGYEKFAVRAGKDRVPSFEAFLQRINQLVLGTRPAVIVCGTYEARRLSPHRTYPTKLNGAKAIACCWNLEWACGTTTEAILAILATRFHIVGDFCCGYGRTARIFANHGKRAIVSDLNPKCIGKIAQDFGSKS